jgi:integrase
MVSTLKPLRNEELERLLNGLSSVIQPDGMWPWVDVRQATLLFLFTGIHPSDVADPVGSRLRYDHPYVRWTRAKNNRSMEVPADPHLQPFVASLVSTLQGGHDRFTYNRMVHFVGDQTGLPGLSPRTLRHTFGRIVWDATHDVSELIRLMGCDAREAISYMTYEKHEQIDRRLFVKGYI